MASAPPGFAGTLREVLLDLHPGAHKGGREDAQWNKNLRPDASPVSIQGARNAKPRQTASCSSL